MNLRHTRMVGESVTAWSIDCGTAAGEYPHDFQGGRFQTRNGVFTLPPGKRAAFEADVRDLLAASCPDPMFVPYRVCGIPARN